ncbi:MULTISPECIES: exosporium glycoprotein BclB-related protein [Lysinibacillus]|uniref:exosporium glycoprotein BclB-related protein n=1 Tax=Lysinibacillus TaxID=400634 RepID=UPI00083CA0C2|nr:MULTISPECIES: exosporium glycoprotein BclB-related protein [Lysinibacillus]
MCMNCNSSCGFSSNNECENFGPFLAVDAACITPTPVTTGSIIPFSSGTATLMQTLANGAIGAVSLVGFGSTVTGLALVGSDVNLTTGAFTEAFTVPRAGTVTSIAASFKVTLAIAAPGLPGSTVVNARIYRAPAGSNVFSPTNVTVNLNPALTGIISAGIVLNGTSDNFAPLPVVAGDNLLMVFSITATGTALSLAAEVQGTATAGITID